MTPNPFSKLRRGMHDPEVTWWTPRRHCPIQLQAKGISGAHHLAIQGRAVVLACNHVALLVENLYPSVLLTDTEAGGPYRNLPVPDVDAAAPHLQLPFEMLRT